MAVINFKVLPASSAAASAAAAAANSIYNCHMMAMVWDRLQPCTLKAFVPGAACGISRALKLAFTTIVDPPKANLTRPRPNSRTAKFSPNSAYISLLAGQAANWYHASQQILHSWMLNGNMNQQHTVQYSRNSPNTNYQPSSRFRHCWNSKQFHERMLMFS